MIATTDPSDMIPEERRAEVASILAAGYLRLARRPRPLPSGPQDEARDLPPLVPLLQAILAREPGE